MKMKFTTKVLLLTNAFSASVAFAPPRPHSSTTRSQCRFTPIQPQQTSTKLPLFPDPSTLESSTILTSDIIDGLVSTVGSLALLGSVGFGVMSGMKDDDWDYEYKAGNDEAKLKYGNNADLALMEVSPEEVAEDIVKGEITEAQKSFYGKDDAATKEAPPKKSPPAATPVVTAQPAKATKTSDKVLKATEVAKDEVKKKGVQETKEKMSSKSSSVASSTPEPVEETTEEEVTEVEEVKEEKGTKRKLAKGVTLIVAAGVVAVARNVVKAWLGRGML